jgi:exodeoxyribonuclease-3
VKCSTFNANSVRARLPIIIDWVEREQPDTLCIQETKVQDKDFPTSEFEHLSYQVLIKGQKSYNGVALLTRLPLEDPCLSLYGQDDEEARFISARVDGIPIINVYVPQGFAPGTQKFEYKLRWLGDLLSFIKKHYEPDQSLLVVGDFNVALDEIDVYDPEGLKGQAGFHPDEQAIMRALLEWGLVDVFRKHEDVAGHYTFWDYRIPNAFKRNMGWRIDYILATNPLAGTCQRIWIDTEPRTLKKPSDHTFLAAEFNLGV